MRFYRVVFWIATLYHLALGLWFLGAPHLARPAFEYPVQTPLFLLQVHGLLYFMMACGLAYAAERPSKSLAIVVLCGLATILIPIFTGIAWWRGELSVHTAQFHGISSLFWMPIFISYIFWFFHVPRPSRFLNYMGLFGRKGQG